MRWLGFVLATVMMMGCSQSPQTTAGVAECQGLEGEARVSCLSRRLETALMLVDELRREVEVLRQTVGQVEQNYVTGAEFTEVASDVDALNQEVSELVDEVVTKEAIDGLASESWVQAQGFLTQEQDPLFAASNVGGINATLISQWNDAFAWGNHANAGYLTQEVDPQFSASIVAGVDGGRLANWDTAYSWGDHNSAGYLTTESDPTFSSSAAVSITGARLANWDSAFAWGDHSGAGYLRNETDPAFTASAAATLTFDDLTGLDNAVAFTDDLSAYLSVDDASDSVMFSGANVFVQSGAGSSSAAVNGVGNLIVGYDESASDLKTGSHNVVIGPEHTYTSYGGLIAGTDNDLTAPGGSVLGGQNNDATASGAVVLGGNGNSNAVSDTIVP